MAIRLTGVDGALTAIQQVRDGAGQFRGQMVRIGSPLSYASPIETGVYRTGPRAGRIARKAGPARYLQSGLASIRPEMGAELTAALPKGAGAVNLAIGRLARRAQQRAQGVVPVRSGRLKGSIRVVTP
jgi:hypothetical protein